MNYDQTTSAITLPPTRVRRSSGYPDDRVTDKVNRWRARLGWTLPRANRRNDINSQPNIKKP